MDQANTELNSQFTLSEENIKYFRENGYIKLKNILSEQTLEYYSKEISKEVAKLDHLHLPMEERNTYQKAFIQVSNIWTQNEIIKEFVFSKRLANVAAELLGVEAVRLYHDQALYKEAGGGYTPWHADQYYWNVSNEKTVTIWIPLQNTPLEMGPLSFSLKSHDFSFGRNMPISDESEVELQKALEAANYEHIIEPYELGEVSYHYGWTFHTAGANLSKNPRRVITMIYMDKDIRLIEPLNNHQADWEQWSPGAKLGEIMDTPLNPVI